MNNVKERMARILRNKKTVVTRAIFWKIPHNTKSDDVRLKIGRYKKSEDFLQDETVELDEPKSELTLDQEEFRNLIEFLQDHYEPFKAGVKAYIPLDSPFDVESAKQIRALFSLPDKQELVDFILKNEVIPDELRVGLEQARRVRAVRAYEQMLKDDLREHPWQLWFQKHDWVLGSEFVRLLDERYIDTKNISDFLLQAYDGFLDVVEIKRPEGGLKFWADTLDHGNYVPSSDLIKAITQASHYLYEVEREANSVKFLERVDGVRVVKPRCVLVYGRSHDWNSNQIQAYRILNAGYANLTFMTYDHVLERAKRMVGVAS